MTRNILKNIGCAALISMSAVSASAQSSANAVNASTDWAVFQEGKECWIVSAPSATTITENGKKVTANRSDVLLFVTYDKSRGVSGEVSFTAGYGLKPTTPVSMQIGSSKYTMIPEGEWAWADGSAQDEKIRASMKRGSTAVVTGNSSRGKTTKDTFSLKGFTAALEDAQKRCG